MAVLQTGHTPPAVRFTLDDAQRAASEWGANCGPGALAAITGLTLEQVRPHIPLFEQRRYTSPSMMLDAINVLSCLHKFRWRMEKCAGLASSRWPLFGLARVQWGGPWMKPGVPARAQYAHTHWVGGARDGSQICVFDINCMCIGGWVTLEEWSGSVVPWLLRETQKRADGTWHLTHVIEVKR